MNSVHDVDVFKKYLVIPSIMLIMCGQVNRLFTWLSSIYRLSSCWYVLHHGSSKTPACTPGGPYKVLPNLILVRTSLMSDGMAFTSRLVFIRLTSAGVMESLFSFFPHDVGLFISACLSPLLKILLYIPDPDLFLVMKILMVGSVPFL